MVLCSPSNLLSYPAMKWDRLVFFAAILLPCLSWATDPYPVTYERNVAVKMRDGVILHADIFRPKADGKFPVLLQRTPYDKNNEVSMGLAGAARGYVVMVQDVRGRYSSEGEWYTARIVQVKGGEFKVHYIGYGEDEDTWVKEAAMKPVRRTRAKPTVRPIRSRAPWAGIFCIFQMLNSLFVSFLCET